MNSSHNRELIVVVSRSESAHCKRTFVIFRYNYREWPNMRDGRDRVGRAFSHDFESYIDVIPFEQLYLITRLLAVNYKYSEE